MKIILGLAACKANTTRKEANKSMRFMEEADHPVSVDEAQAKEFALFQGGFGVTTALHLLGIDHKRLTYRYQGRDFRLTDVHGHVVKDIIA